MKKTLPMLRSLLIFLLFFIVYATPSLASAAEVLFTRGPQEYEGVRYYWLAEWQLDIALPNDIEPDDKVEVLFGSKGNEKRTLYYDYDGKSGSLTEVRPTPYEWVALPISNLKANKHVLLYGKGHSQVAFIAGVRANGKSTAKPTITPLSLKTKDIKTVSDGTNTLTWAAAAGFEVNEKTQSFWEAAPINSNWERAARSARYAGIALSKVQRWLHDGCLPLLDKKTGLFRPTGAEWNYWDTAADCYPFYVWAAYYTDLEILNTVMLDTLEAEQRLCNHVDRLPVSYDMDKGKQIDVPVDRMIFGASEYAKDGLTPIVEITGRDYPWFDRMRGIVDDIFKHAAIETTFGKIPSENIEVNGELLQMLPRLYCMTKESKYLDWANRLADYYLLPGGFVPKRLSDHGCEIIGGLGLLFAVEQEVNPEKCAAYQPHLEYMFDTILERGVNSDGIIVGELQESLGPHDDITLRDGWGYDLVGFLDYDLALQTNRYSKAIQKPLTNLLKPRYLEFNWDHGSRDNIADAVEGGLYLLYRFPTPEAFLWADREIATMLVNHVEPDLLWGVHKLEANTVRTVLIHTMLHTRNTIARPWQQGLELGAAPCGEGICIYMKSEHPYEGILQFDIPRQRITMGFTEDWPRMNTVPEWFTVEPDEDHKYRIDNVDTGTTEVVSGALLSKGFLIKLESDTPLRLIVSSQ